MKPFAEEFPAGNISHHFAGGVYAKELVIPAGFWLKSHRHVYDHISVLASGTVRLTIRGETHEMVGPRTIIVPAWADHEIEAVTTAVWLCIHATSAADPDTVDETLIAREPV
tara:strand:- start:4152 stop:4487 length:336 start_codon:yes stop_codon:yes gene_type:complete